MQTVYIKYPPPKTKPKQTNKQTKWGGGHHFHRIYSMPDTSLNVIGALNHWIMTHHVLPLFAFASENTEVQSSRGKCEPSHPGSQSMLRTQTHSCFTMDSISQEPPNRRQYSSSSHFCLLPAAAVTNCHKLLTLNSVSLLSGSSAGENPNNPSVTWSCIPSRNPGDTVCPLLYKQPAFLGSPSSPLSKPAMSEFRFSHNSFFLYKSFLAMLAAPGSLRKVMPRS